MFRMARSSESCGVRSVCGVLLLAKWGEQRAEEGEEVEEFTFEMALE